MFWTFHTKSCHKYGVDARVFIPELIKNRKVKTRSKERILKNENERQAKHQDSGLKKCNDKVLTWLKTMPSSSANLNTVPERTTVAIPGQSTISTSSSFVPSSACYSVPNLNRVKSQMDWLRVTFSWTNKKKVKNIIPNMNYIMWTLPNSAICSLTY